MNLEIFKINDLSGKYYKESYIKKNYIEEYNYVNEYIKYDVPFKEKIYLCINNMNFIPKCKNENCVNDVKFKSVSFGYFEYCCVKCSSSDLSIIDRRKKTCFDKYGVDNPMKNSDIKIKLNNSIFDKYGVDNISKLDIVKKKKSSTNLLKYGCEYNSQRKDIKVILSDNIIKLNKRLEGKRSQKRSDYWKFKLDKLGINFLSNESGSILNIECFRGHQFTIKKDCLNDRIRYNNEICTICNPIIKKEKLVYTNSNFIEKSNIIHNNKYEYLSSYEGSKNNIKILCKKCSNIFYQISTSHLSGSGCPKCCSSISNKEILWLNKLGIDDNNRQVRIKINDRVYNVDGINGNIIYEFYGDYWHGNPSIYNEFDFNKSVGKTFGELYKKTIDRERILEDSGYKVISIWESEYDLNSYYDLSTISEFINSLNINFIENYFDVYNINFYFPDLKIGIVVDFLKNSTTKNYYHDRYLYFNSKGVRIISISEFEYENKFEIIKSRIKYILKIGVKKIYARDCLVKKVDQKMSKSFLNQNHLQGYVYSDYYLGLFYEDELVSIMGFASTEGRKKMDYGNWDLNRFVVKVDTSVVGGFSKLLKFFINNVDVYRIISYADLFYSNGDIYLKNNFKIKDILVPDYKWVIENKKYNKQKFKKSNLIKLGYDENKSESEIMFERGGYKIWDCGKIKFEMLTDE